MRWRHGVLAAADVSSRISAAAESFGMSSRMSQLSSSVKACTPSAAACSAPATAPASTPSSPSMPRPIKGADLAADLDCLVLSEVAEVLHLQLALGVLVDGRGVDHADRAARVEPLQFGDDLTVEVGMIEIEHDELNRTNCHFLSLSHDRRRGGAWWSCLAVARVCRAGLRAWRGGLGLRGRRGWLGGTAGRGQCLDGDVGDHDGDDDERGGGESGF